MNRTEKLQETEQYIKCWVDSWGEDNVYVAYSGGWDSTVLLHIARRLFPNIKAVFSNTGLEFPELVKFVKQTGNTTIIRPKFPFHKVIEKYGWPIISKNVAMAVSRYRNTKREDQKQYRLYGRYDENGRHLRAGTIPKKWHHLINAPFDISDECCRHMKKNPFRDYEKDTGYKPMLGIMADESDQRRRDVKSRGCNVYNAKKPQSRPIAHWSKDDVVRYTDQFDVPICDIYQKGYDRTGCMFCMFGLEQEMKKTGTNRFLLMKVTHPKQYKYIIETLGGGQVLDFLGIPY